MAMRRASSRKPESPQNEVVQGKANTRLLGEDDKVIRARTQTHTLLIA